MGLGTWWKSLFADCRRAWGSHDRRGSYSHTCRKLPDHKGQCRCRCGSLATFVLNDNGSILRVEADDRNRIGASE
jgi:hypothetical protein